MPAASDREIGHLQGLREYLLIDDVAEEKTELPGIDADRDG